MSPRPHELAAMNVADARDHDFAAQIATFLGMSLSAVRRRLEGAHGRMLVCNCFAAEWPELLDRAALEDLNVADARDRDLVPDIASVTGLSERAARRRLNGAHGRTLLPNCFGDCWPEPDGEVDVDQLGELSVAHARDHGLADAVAKAIGLSLTVVRRRLDRAHGRQLLRSCFADCWPGGSVRGPLPAEELAELNVATALERDLVDDIIRVTRLSAMAVRRRLNRTHGRTLLVNCFWEHWPVDVDTDDLAALNVADARLRGLAGHIAQVTGLSVAAVERRLERAHGRQLIHNCFADRWPDGDAEVETTEDVTADGDEDDHNDRPEGDSVGADDLAGIRVAEARDGDLAPAIARVTRLTVTQVRERLEAAHGRMLVQNCFADAWPGASRGARTSAGQGTLRVINGRYQLVARIGAGGFGLVYEVQDLRFPDRSIVIKLPADRERQSSEALRREFAVTHRLKHQNICKYFDCAIDTESSVPFLVMEHGGDSLADIVESEGALPVARAIHIITQAADALDYVHARNLIHGDVSPGNILVSDGVVTVTDFGISSLAEPAVRTGGQYTMVAIGHHGHHRIYRAPEVPPASRRSDQYSLALVFCVMLRGELFEERFRFEPFKALTNGQNNALERALSEHASDRFSSCGELAGALAAGSRD